MSRLITRRSCLAGLSAGFAGSALAPMSPAHAATPELSFNELYGSFSALGLEFSDKVKTLTGQRVGIEGFMAPPLKAEATFFVLTEIPMALCPFCSTDADWPDNILVVYLDRKQTFTDPNQRIEARGLLERGSWTDPDTGFVSQLRLREARFAKV
ncbi:hypothetical protein [Paracoccus aminophilus]|uniref:Uncharacterized protein n=1 Tax=Paracoccus aminophilus JCM 7686 TaxID=1367847 RepID=S5Y3S5_PARAH|nr:hypothetical protein [Paracoccus aminophilus]AGT10395.1 hypothetical protein JCM7686_3360 [Paracoccus aminophilus JCM 7686]